MAQAGGLVNMNDGSRLIQTKQLIIPKGRALVNNLNDNGLNFGNDQLTLTNRHASIAMYGELLFTVEINKNVHWNAMTAISVPLLTDTMINKGILTGLLSLTDNALIYAFGEFKNTRRKFSLFNINGTLANLHYNCKTKDDSASTVNELSITLRCGEARIKTVENINVIFVHYLEIYSEKKDKPSHSHYDIVLPR